LPGLETADYRPWIPWLAGTSLILVTAAAWRMAHKAPMVAAGWLWFLVSLLPVIGIIQVGAQGRADRYVYVPMLGLLSCGMGLVHFLCNRVGVRESDSGTKSIVRLQSGSTGKLCHRLLYGCLACLAGIWAIGSVRQLPVWKDSLSLWQHALPRCPSCFVVQYNLGTAYMQVGRYQEALPHLEAARAIRPNDSDPFVRLAEVHNLLGELEAADAWYQGAIERSPRNADYHRGRGYVLTRQKDWPAALAEFTTALGLRPDDSGIMADMVRTISKMGDKNRARELLFRAMEISPNNEELKELRTLVR
jgi:protein O-mannosyl-transferase